MDQIKINQQQKDQQDKRKEQEQENNSGVRTFTPPRSITSIPPQKPNILQRMQALPEDERPEKLKPNLIQKIQRKKEEEQKLQMKKEDEEKETEEEGPSQLKKDEEEKPIQGKLQLKDNSESQSATSENSGAGSKMSGELQGKMENSFGTDFSGVNIHANSDKAPALNALAFTQGNDIHFAPGQYNPDSQKGQELLGHELTHVVQQKQGRVQTTTQLKGAQINDSPELEKEADEMGEKAAKGIPQPKFSSEKGNSVPPYSLVQKKDNDPLKVDKGQITFDAEGNNDSTSRYYSRRAHWPGGPSGVTIGRGYDLGNRGSKNLIKEELTSVGIDYSKFSGAIGLQGEEAQEWLDDNKDSLPEITAEQQQTLFTMTYATIESDVKRISTKEDVVEKYGEVDFEKLDPTIRDIIVDLRYRGDYSGTTRKYVQEPMVKNDLQALYEVMKDKSKWASVPADRFKRRVEAIETALGIKGNNTNKPAAGNTAQSGKTGANNQVNKGEYIVKSGETPDIIAAKFKTDASTIKSLNRDKLKQFPTKSGKTVEGFSAGDKIRVPTEQKSSEAPTKSPIAETPSGPEKGLMDKSFELINDAYDTATEYAAESWHSFSETIGSFFSSSNESKPATAGNKTEAKSTPATTTPAKTTPEKTETKTTAPAPAAQNASSGSIYSSQRDNKYSGNDIYGAGTKGGNVSGDNMCNVTSLAMTLKSHASEHDLRVNTVNLLIGSGGGYTESKRAELMGYDLEDLIIRRFVQLGADYFKKNVMGKNFEFTGNPPHQFGACLAHVGKQILSGVKKTLDFYDIFDKTKYKTSVAPELEKGNTGFGGTYLTGGHVVNLVKVVDDGLIINDPYGLILGEKGKYVKNGSKVSDNKQKISSNMAVIEKRLKYNSALLSQTKSYLTSTEKFIPHNMGENVFVDWDDVKTFSIFRWLVILKVN